MLLAYRSHRIALCKQATVDCFLVKRSHCSCIIVPDCYQTALRLWEERSTEETSSFFRFRAERPFVVGSARQVFPCILFSSSCFLVHALDRTASAVSLLPRRNSTSLERKAQCRIMSLPRP